MAKVGHSVPDPFSTQLPNSAAARRDQELRAARFSMRMSLGVGVLMVEQHVKKALAINPTLERAQVISAIIDIDLGDAGAAHKKLIKVLEANPRSPLAKAALRKARG